MKKELPPTLSEHLLEEARGFHLYPERSRRTKANRQYAEVWDKAWQKILEWSCALEFSWTLDCERVLAGGVSR